jgi:hypothetical protein
VTERRLLPVGALVAVLLVLVALATHGRPLSTRNATGPNATFFAVLLLVGAAAALAVVVYLRRFAGLVVVAVALAFAAYALTSHPSGPVRQRGTPCPTCSVSPLRHRRAPAKSWDVHLPWAAIVLALLVVGAGGYARRRRPGPPAAPRRVVAVSLAIDDSLDDLRNDPDIRRAIIAAYARMERALAAHGRPRAPAEAPFEYFERSLVGFDGARRLTDLFERAKFSHHEPAEAMRQEAIDALIALRADLVAA